MNSNMEVEDVWYGRTVIRSRYKLFYEIAQKIADGLGNDEIIENVPEMSKYHKKEIEFK